MHLIPVLLLLAASMMTTEAFYYYYPYSYSYYPYYSYYSYPYYSYWGKRGESVKNPRTECTYVKNDRSFKCRGPLGVVECDADWHMDDSVKLELFAIGKPVDTLETIKAYKLFPRRIDNSAWMNNMVEIKGDVVNVTLHAGAGETRKDFGVGIREIECFGKLKQLFKDSIRDELIHLEDIDSDVHVLGDFSLVVRRKRHEGKYQDAGAEQMDF